MTNGHYRQLGWMAALSFVSMYLLMYSMVNEFSNVYMSLNQVYMAGLMAAPMIVIELLLMLGMYPRRRVNGALIAISIVGGCALFFFIREQTAINDSGFVRSMIPHHSGAVLMCREANLRDPELLALCEQIVESEQREIDQMSAILRRLE